MSKDCVEMFEINKRFIHGSTMLMSSQQEDETETPRNHRRLIKYKDYDVDDLKTISIDYGDI